MASQIQLSQEQIVKINALGPIGASLQKTLAAFCNDSQFTDTSTLTYDDVQAFHKKFLSMIQSLHQHIDVIFPINHVELPSSHLGQFLICGTSENVNPTEYPSNIGAAIVQALKEQFPEQVYTMGTKNTNLEKQHAQFDALTNENDVSLSRLILASQNQEHGITACLVVGKHNARDNMEITQNVYNAFNKDPFMKELICRDLIKIVVVGTDACNQSDAKTFYKINKGNMSYALSKLVEALVMLMLVNGYDYSTEELKELLSQDAYTNDDVSTIQYPTAATNTKTLLDMTVRLMMSMPTDEAILLADCLSDIILGKIKSAKNISWVENLSVIISPMHLDRWDDMLSKELTVKKEALTYEKMVIAYTNHVLFRLPNMITTRRAGSYSMAAILEVLLK